jgi:hypothetical protein
MKRSYATLWIALASGALAASSALAADDSAVIEQLRRELQELRQEVQTLRSNSIPAATAPVERAPAQDSDSLLGPDFLKAKGLTFSFYGESKYRFPESGANSFDAHRFVLSPHYQLADWLVFNAELELEHGGVDDSTGRGSRFDGELELEQFYVDILINDYFNIRSLGIDLVPVGRINLYHEPTLFYSTERPELYREIIPSTWMEPSIGFFGKITDTLDYRVQVSSGLEDFSSSAGGAGVTAAAGMRNARPRLRGANENSLGYSGRLHFNGVEGLDASTSFYITEVQGFNRQRSLLGLFDAEATYRIQHTGLELRGDFAYWFIESPENLIANNTGTTTDDVGKEMYGWYVEAAYHFWPEAWKTGKGENMDLVPFARFSQIVTQSRLPSGSDELDNGTANRDFITIGLSYFLNQNFVLKGDWRHNLDGSATTETSAASQDYFQIGAGMFF